ncbi:MAG: hypothetical protein QXV32_07680 [Conexivisphaerales archaeon]
MSADLYFSQRLAGKALPSFLASISITVFLAQLAVSLLIAGVSLKGYRAYGSRTLLMLSLSFFLIAFGVSLQSLFQVSGSEVLQFFGAASEASGYLILALSHVYTVRSSVITSSSSSSSSSSLPVLLILQFPDLSLLYVAAKSISFFLLLYIFIETLIFAVQNRSRAAAIPSIGFLLLTFSAYANLFLNSLNFLLIAVEIAKLLGFAVLASPLAVFALRRGQKRG